MFFSGMSTPVCAKKKNIFLILKKIKKMFFKLFEFVAPDGETRLEQRLSGCYNSPAYFMLR